MKDKVAYITGGSKGIGFAVAKALLAQGAKVAITSRSKESADAAAKELGGDPSNVLALQSAVGSFASESAAINAVAPAVVQTKILDQLTPQQVSYMTDKIPMRRTGRRS